MKRVLASLRGAPNGFNVVFSGQDAPAGTPEPALAKLREAARIAAADPRFVAAMATVETPIQYLDAPELARFREADAQKLGEAVRQVGSSTSVRHRDSEHRTKKSPAGCPAGPRLYLSGGGERYR